MNKRGKILILAFVFVILFSIFLLELERMYSDQQKLGAEEYLNMTVHYSKNDIVLEAEDFKTSNAVLFEHNLTVSTRLRPLINGAQLIYTKPIYLPKGIYHVFVVAKTTSDKNRYIIDFRTTADGSDIKSFEVLINDSEHHTYFVGDFNLSSICRKIFISDWAYTDNLILDKIILRPIYFERDEIISLEGPYDIPNDTRSKFLEEYLELDASIELSEYNLIWGHPYQIRSYLNMYNITKNISWIEKAIVVSDYLINNSDLIENPPGWGEIRGKPTFTTETMHPKFEESSVADGVVSIAILEVVLTIKQNPNLRAYEPKANNYLDIIKQVIDKWDDHWIETNDGGYYPYWYENSTLSVPNAFLSLGTAEILLSDILDDKAYLEKTEKMACHFKSNLYLNPFKDSYYWYYSFPNGHMEDISHGKLDIEFVIAAYEHGIVFNNVDIRRFINTLSNLQTRNEEPPYLYALVNKCEGDTSNTHALRSFGWIGLAKYDKKIFQICLRSSF